MNKNELKTNDFASHILSDYESFKYDLKSVEQKQLNETDNSDIYSAYFKWSWNCYSGYGIIDFYYKNKKVCNSLGNDYSSITVTNDTRHESISIKHTCSIYNDKLLEELFSRMLISDEMTQFLKKNVATDKDV